MDSIDDEDVGHHQSSRLLPREDDLFREWRIGLVSQAALNNLLEPDEVVVDAFVRNWWYAHRMFFGLSFVGTLAFLALLVWQLATHSVSKYFYYFLMMAMFPILLLGAVVQALRARKHETWTAISTKRIIQYTDAESISLIKLSNILSWRPFTNWLMWSKEIELKVKPEQAFNVTTISRQSPFKLEYLDGLLPTDRVALENCIEDQIGSGIGEGNVVAAANASSSADI